MATRIDRETFLDTFAPMAREGKSAVEIGRALGIEGDDKSVSMKVSQKATVYRKEFAEFAEVEADKQGLKGAKREAYLESVAALVPKLKTRNRASTAVSDYVAKMLAAADSEEETESPE